MHRIEINCWNESNQILDITEVILQKQSDYQEIAIYDTEQFGKCLFLDGVIQSAKKDHEQYDRAVLSQMKADDSELLVLGGGDGHTAKMALRLNPDIHVTIVELDLEVVRTSRHYLQQQVFDHPNVRLIIGDAIAYLEKADSGQFDGVICDLTDYPKGNPDFSVEGFYIELFALLTKILSPPAWITAYGGCIEETVDDIIQQSDRLALEKDRIQIESFGEPCFLLHANLPKEKP